MYKVILVNVGNTIYQGNFHIEALYAAQFSGLECAVYKGNDLYASFAPIGGWKFFG